MKLSRTLERKFEGHTVIDGGSQILKCIPWDNMAGWWPAGGPENDWHIITTLVAAGESLARVRQTCNWRCGGQFLRRHEAKLSFSALDIEKLSPIRFRPSVSQPNSFSTFMPEGIRIEFNRFVEIERRMVLPFTQEITNCGIEVTSFDVWTQGAVEAYGLRETLERWMVAAREDRVDQLDWPVSPDDPTSTRPERPGETRR